MVNGDPVQNAHIKQAGNNKKTYQKPKILSVEELEVVAATCDGGKAIVTGGDACGTTGPVAS
jgi:hypothetical protein